MQAIGTVLPEFDSLGQNAETRPVVRAGDRAIAIFFVRGFQAFLECAALVERAGLVGSNGAEARHTGAASEIGIGFGCGNGFDRPLDPDLTATGLPVKQQGGVRIGVQLAALAAVQIGIENKNPIIHALEWQHPDGWVSVRRDRKSGG